MVVRAQVVLIPTESKWLIAKAVLKLDAVKQALARGTVVIHASSATYFVTQEIIGRKPALARWASGIVVPKGTCTEMGGHVGLRAGTSGGPGAFPHSVVIRGGQMSVGERLDSLLERMGPGDVYIKGANALDAEGTVGVLLGNPHGAGTIGLVMAAQRRRKYDVIFSVGLERLVPGRIKEAAKEAGKHKYYYSMGMNCGLVPCRGTVVTEIEAVKLLSGAEAIPIASGGLAGAEGAVVLVLKGEREQVDKALEYIESVKGARLPQVRIPECHSCGHPFCDFPILDKHWV